jgi:hypothetical protein
MKISDVLRAMAEIVEKGPHSEVSKSDTSNFTAFNGSLEPVELPDVKTQSRSPRTERKTSAGNDMQPEELYIPPLQMKMELLKKAVDVENIYDDGTPQEQEEEREERDGPWVGADHTYEYVGAPQTEAAADKEQEKPNAKVEKERAEEVNEDGQISRMRELAGLNPVVLDELASDFPEE